MKRAALGAARIAAAAAAALALALQAGCGLFGEKKAPPAPLPELRSNLSVGTAWRLSIGSGKDTFLQPAVVENALYAAAAGGAVLRIDPATGSQVWRTDVQSRISAGVGADGFTVAVATPRGEVIALDADGVIRWRAQVSSDVVSPPLVGRGLVVVRSTDHRLSAFEADSGKRRWVYSRQLPPLTLRASTELAFAGDNVLVGYPGGRLAAVALSNGAVRWEASVSEPKGTTEVERLADVLGPIAVAGGLACAASFQGRVMCADAGTGSLRWARDLSAGAGVARDPRSVYAVDAASQLLALSIDGGASLWRNDRLTHRRLTTPLALTGAVVVGDLEGYVHFLSADEGSPLARLRVDSSPIVARPMAWSDGAVVLTTDGTLTLLTVPR
ncbi:MAG: outer membrane protein assembly factor BamB [Burkholderiaceae bacterium]|jgi:outer membrane protein assembly factor BamB|nr:outer membrane protein assembly factor BamB [Burkholderiaceae bacterium]